MKQEKVRIYLSSFLKHDSGAPAVEFALVAIPFFTALMGIIELSILHFYELNIKDAFSSAIREIRVGTFTGGKSEFVTTVCNRTYLNDCTNGLKVDVRNISTEGWAGVSNYSAAEACADSANDDDFDVNSGGSNDIILARVCYKWQMFTPLISGLYADTPSSSYKTLSATSVFRNEPY